MASAPAPIEILRHRVLIRHIDPLTREMCLELTIHNASGEETDEAVLVEDTYRPGLCVLDNDDSQLALLPNDAIRHILKESGEPENLELVERMNRHEVFVYWIKFPTGRELEPHETRVIRLVHTESLLHEYRWSSLPKLFFNIPEYLVEVTVPDSTDYPHFVSVSPPEGHQLVVEELKAVASWETASRELTPADHFHVGTSGPYIDIAIPHVEGRVAQVRMVYGVYPERNEQHLLTGVILGLLAVSAAFMIAMFLFWQDPGIFGSGFPHTAIKALNGNSLLLGTSLALLSAGFVGLAGGSVFQRTKWWASASGAVAALGIFFSVVHS